MATATEQVEAPVHPTNKQVGAEIRAWAGRREVSQVQLADALGIHPATLNRKLKGIVPISMDELSIVCERLGVSVSDLMKDAETNAHR